MRILLHACCGPCATHCVHALREAGWEPELFYANDNIDSEAEFEKRLEALRTFAGAEQVPLAVNPYHPATWERAIAGCEGAPEGGARCARCFRHNLGIAARYAAEHGFAHFTTSLTVSPHKRSDMVFAAGADAAQALGPSLPVTFEPFNFKKKNGFLDSIRLAQAYGLYRQNYCGCRYSKRTEPS